MRKFNLRYILALAWPISLQGILTNFLSVIDVAMVSHLGDSAVAAVGLGNRYQFMLMVILLGCAWTVGVLGAQYYGARQVERIRSTLFLAACVALVGLSPIILLTLYFASDIIALGSNDTDIIHNGAAYLRYTIPSLIFIAIILVYENAIRALGQTKLPMLMSTLAIGINIVLNYWFINGGLGLPAMGVTGAAVATAIARLLQLLLLLAYLHYSKHILSLQKQDFRPEKSEAWKIITMAAPMMGSFGVWSVGTFMYQLIYGNMGTTELAVISVLTPIEAIFLACFFGLASACSIMIGQQLGANEFDQAWFYAKVFSVVNICIAVLLGLSLALFSPFIFLAFADLPTETIDEAKVILYLIALMSWLKVTNMTLAMGILRAGGDNRIVMYIDVIGMWHIALPLTYCAAFIWHWPLILVVATTYSEELSKALLFGYRVSMKNWLRNLS